MDTDPVLPPLPEGYEWRTDDGDYNICKVDEKNINKSLTSGLICYVRIKGHLPLTHPHYHEHLVRVYLNKHKEEAFVNLQDAIDVMATRFTLGLYFQDES